MSERLKWISPNNPSQIEWACGYLTARSDHTRFKITHNSGTALYQQLIFWDQGHQESAEYRELLGRMRGAWAQKKYRGRKKGKRAYSIVLPVSTKQQLDRIAKDLDSSLAETVEKLIPSSKEHLQDFIDNERRKRQKSKNTGDILLRNVEDYRNNAEIFAELLTLSLIDLTICKLGLSAHQQPHSEAEMSEVEQLSTNLLERLLNERNKGLPRRQSTISLKSQTVTPNRTLIEQRLKHFAQNSNPAPIPNAHTPETSLTSTHFMSPINTNLGTNPETPIDFDAHIKIMRELSKLI